MILAVDIVQRDTSGKIGADLVDDDRLLLVRVNTSSKRDGREENIPSIPYLPADLGCCLR